MAIGTPIVSLGNLGHPDGGDSPKVFVLLALTSPGVGFDLTKVSEISNLRDMGPRPCSQSIFQGHSALKIPIICMLDFTSKAGLTSVIIVLTS